MVEYLSMKRIYLGSLQELELRLCGDIAAVKRGRPFYPVVVVVPSNLAGVYLRRSLARRGGSYCGVRFLTLNDLAVWLAGEGAGDEIPPVMPPFAEKWLAALTARKAAGGYFGPVAGHPGFSDALLQTFQELGDAGLTQVPLPEGGDQRRIAGLQHLYQYYRELCQPFITRESIFAAAARVKPPAPLMIALYGIYQLTTLEKRLLVSLTNHGGLTLYWQESVIRFAPVGQLMHWFQQLGFTVGRLPSRQPEKGNLARLQRYLFQEQPGGDAAAAGDQTLNFICAPDEVGEVEEIAREIIGLARAGLRFGEIAVFFPQPIYAGLLREKLSALGIPYYLAGGLPLAQTRAGRTFLLILEMIGSDYSRQKVTELLSYAPFCYDQILKEGKLANPAFWDYLAREAGVIKGRRQWREALKHYQSRLRVRAGEPPQGRVAEQLFQTGLLLDMVTLFFRMLDPFYTCRSWSDLVEAAVELLERLFHSGEEREALLRLVKRLQRLDECGGEFTLKPALELFRSALQSAALPRGRFQQEGINLLPLRSAGALRFPVIFIPGMAEKIIPSPVSPDPLLPESERRALSGKLPLRRQDLELEALRFTLAVGGAVKKAVLSWPRVSAAGSREQLPSAYLSRCGEALCAVRPGHDQLSQLPGYRYLESDSENRYLAHPVTAVEYDLNCGYRLPEAQLFQYYRRLSPRLGDLLTADLSRFAYRWGAYDAIFMQEPSRCLLDVHLDRRGGLFSATALEDYARCPYSYFLKRLLGLTPLEAPEALLSMDPLTRGRLLHKILEEFYRGASQQGLLPVERFPGECRSLLSRVSREYFLKVPPEDRPPFPLLWELQKRTFEETLQALLDWEIESADGFVPEGFEVSFGFREGDKTAVALELPSGEQIYFRGRIDRVDRRGELIRVIDYKTGRKRFKDESFAGGEALQLPVYLLAAAQLYPQNGPESAVACAYHLSPEGVKTVLFSGDSWDRKKALLKEAAKIICGGIAAGRFFPYPNPSCRYCDYGAVCGPDIEKLYRRKATDSLLDFFLKLKEDFD